MVRIVNVQRIQRGIVAVAALVCLLFVATLLDYSPFFLVVHRVVAPEVPASVGDRDGQLFVEVHDPKGPPIPRARITVLLIREQKAYLAGFAETDPHGKASLAGLPRGEMWILADAEGRGRASTRLVLGKEPRTVKLVAHPAQTLKVHVSGDDGKAIKEAKVLVSCNDPLPYLGTTNDKGHATIDRLCPPPYSVEVTAKGYERRVRTGITPGPLPVRISLRRLGTILAEVVLQDGSPAPLSTLYVSGPGLWPARQTQANAFGRSTIAGLPAGSYDVRAVRAELVSDIQHGVVVKHGSQTKVKLTLRVGRNLLVHVTDGDGKDAPGIGGANVVLAEDGLSSFPLEGQTDGEGKVFLGPLPPVPVSASAWAEGFVAKGAVAVPPDANEVRVPLVKAGRLEGDVVDNRGFPVLGASIEVIGTDLSGQPIAETPSTMAFRRSHFSWALKGPRPLIPAGELGVMPGPIPPIPHGSMEGLTAQLAQGLQGAFQPEPWVTDNNGEFSIGPITPGRVSAIVRHPAYVEAISEAVTIPPGGKARVHVVLYRGGTLEGIVLDDRRFPIPGALVQITPKKGMSERSTLTADDGTFAFSAVAAELMITVSRPEAPDKLAYEKKIKVGEEERKEIEIILKRERDAMAVRVLDDRGYPVDAAQITAVSLRADTSLRRTVFTNMEGTADVADAAGLPLRVQVTAPGYATKVETYKDAPKEVELKLSPGLTVKGSVTGRGGRDRLQNARVTVYLETGTRHFDTGPEGEWSLSDMSAGKVRLRIDHDDYVAVEKTVEVLAPSDRNRPVALAAIDLDEAGKVEGEVVDDRGDPVAGARVAKDKVPEYIPVGPLPPGVVATDSQGKFELGGLPEGDVTLEAYAPGVGRGEEKKIAVRVGRTTTRVRVRIEKTGSKAGPAVMAGVPVTLKEAGAEASGILITGVGKDSAAERAGLAPGDLIVRIDGVVPSSVNDARHRLMGPERQEVLLEVQRGNRTEKVRVKRERLRL